MSIDFIPKHGEELKYDKDVRKWSAIQVNLLWIIAEVQHTYHKPNTIIDGLEVMILLCHVNLRIIM